MFQFALLPGFLICIVISVTANSDEFRLINTDKGIVRGHKARDGEYMAYLGIPYAAPPIGDLRFQPPKPVKPWTDVYEANYTVTCPQVDSVDIDCLVVNVFTPINTDHKKLPVLFYIHGGAYLIGHGPTEGVEPLINKNVIVVTFNYRLGALGFLCLGTEFSPGNAGLKDQVAALKWVHRNIKHFGGDEKKVTIYGTSAGAASVELLVLFTGANDDKKMFQRAILESGSALDVWVINEDPIEMATLIYLNSMNSEKLNKVKHVDVSELEAFYRSESLLKLNDLSWDHYHSLTDGTFGFSACVENKFSSEDTYITVHPRKKINGDYNSVPIIMLFATLEGLFLANDQFYRRNDVSTIENNFQAFLPADLNFGTVDLKQQVADQVKNFYFGSSPVNIHENDALLNYLGDSMILLGMMKSLRHHAQRNNVFLMEFAYKGLLGSYDDLFENATAAGHGDVKFYAILNKPIRTDEDRMTVDKVSTLLANFVKFGNPTPYPSHQFPFRWPAVQPGNLTYLFLGPDVQVLDNPYPARMALWDQLYQDYGIKL